MRITCALAPIAPLILEKEAPNGDLVTHIPAVSALAAVTTLYNCSQYSLPVVRLALARSLKLLAPQTLQHADTSLLPEVVYGTDIAGARDSITIAKSDRSRQSGAANSELPSSTSPWRYWLFPDIHREVIRLIVTSSRPRPYPESKPQWFRSFKPCTPPAGLQGHRITALHRSDTEASLLPSINRRASSNWLHRVAQERVVARLPAVTHIH